MINLCCTWLLRYRAHPPRRVQRSQAAVSATSDHTSRIPGRPLPHWLACRFLPRPAGNAVRVSSAFESPRPAFSARRLAYGDQPPRPTLSRFLSAFPAPVTVSEGRMARRPPSSDPTLVIPLSCAALIPWKPTSPATLIRYRPTLGYWLAGTSACPGKQRQIAFFSSVQPHLPYSCMYPAALLPGGKTRNQGETHMGQFSPHTLSTVLPRLSLGGSSPSPGTLFPGGRHCAPDAPFLNLLPSQLLRPG